MNWSRLADTSWTDAQTKQWRGIIGLSRVKAHFYLPAYRHRLPNELPLDKDGKGRRWRFVRRIK